MNHLLLIALLCLLTACSTNQKPQTQNSTAASATSDTYSSSEEVGLIFDVEDSEIVERIIEGILSSNQREREALTFRIYTFNDYQNRTIWLTEAKTVDSNSYWLYIKNADKLTAINEQEFNGKLTSIQKQNHSDMPIYEEENIE